MKKVVTIVGALLVTLVLAACGNAKAPIAYGNATAVSIPTTPIANNESHNVVLTGPPVYKNGGWQATVKVTNVDLVQFDYLIDLTLESADGKTILSQGTGLVQYLNPGQSGTDDAYFTGVPDNLVNLKVEIKHIERTMSNQ